MKTMLSNWSALIGAVALLVTGATCLSAAEGPMGKPATVAFPSHIWKWDKPSGVFPFEQIVEVYRLGILAEVGEIQGKVVFLEISPKEEVAADKWLERRDLWIQILFPGIAKEDVKVAEPDPTESLRSVITCKQGDKSYLVIFAPFYFNSTLPEPERKYVVTVGDTAFFKNAADLAERKVSDEQRSRILKTLFDTK